MLVRDGAPTCGRATPAFSRVQARIATVAAILTEPWVLLEIQMGRQRE